MAENNKKIYRKRKAWTRTETLGFIKCYKARKTEFLVKRKKKQAFENVLNDMIAQNFTDSSTTTDALESKMSHLLRKFRHAESNNAGRRTNVLMCELEELFGARPKYPKKNSQLTLHVGRAPVNFLKKSKNKLIADGVQSETDATNTQTNNITNVDEVTQEAVMDTTLTPCTSKKFQNYYDEKLRLIREEMRAKIAQREEFFEKMKKLFEDRYRKEDEQRKEDEKKRLALLQIFLETQSIKKEHG